MKKYQLSKQKIINPIYFINNFKNFNFFDIYFIVQDDSILEFIRKDAMKECYTSLIDNNIHLTEGYKYQDFITDYDSPFCYLVIDIDVLYSHIDSDISYFIINLVNILDTEKNKFNLFKDMFDLLDTHNFILKFREIPRNTDRYYLSENSLDLLKDQFNYLVMDEID